jgi:hypothetical protein
LIIGQDVESISGPEFRLIEWPSTIGSFWRLELTLTPDTWPPSPAGHQPACLRKLGLDREFPPHAMGEHGGHNALDLGPGPICSGNRPQPAFYVDCR